MFGCDGDGDDSSVVNKISKKEYPKVGGGHWGGGSSRMICVVSSSYQLP